MVVQRNYDNSSCIWKNSSCSADNIKVVVWFVKLGDGKVNSLNSQSVLFHVLSLLFCEAFGMLLLQLMWFDYFKIHDPVDFVQSAIYEEQFTNETYRVYDPVCNWGDLSLHNSSCHIAGSPKKCLQDVLFSLSLSNQDHCMLCATI